MILRRLPLRFALLMLRDRRLRRLVERRGLWLRLHGLVLRCLRLYLNGATMTSIVLRLSRLMSCRIGIRLHAGPVSRLSLSLGLGRRDSPGRLNRPRIMDAILLCCLHGLMRLGTGRL